MVQGRDEGRPCLTPRGVSGLKSSYSVVLQLYPQGLTPRGVSGLKYLQAAERDGERRLTPRGVSGLK